MIDPTVITNYNLNKYQLQEMAIFWLLVAGKTAKTTARLLENMLQHIYREYDVPDMLPFEAIMIYDEDYPGDGLENLLRSCGFGCQKAKARGLRELVNKQLNLKTCSVEELESIYCIGPKTARCFIIHTRPNARYAGLDTHILKWLKSLGFSVPASTPTGRAYARLEEIFLGIADDNGMSPAELDLAVWNAYSSGGEYKLLRKGA